MTKRAIFLCNALDDVTRSERGISTDSPAATKKVILMSRALRLGGARPIILSMGRGGAAAEWRSYSAVVRRIEGLPIIYIPYTSIPIFSKLLSALGLIYVVCKLRLRGIQHLIFYNRTTAFLPTLLASSLMRYKNILDLEDGEVRLGSKPLMLSFTRTVAHLFDFLCDRALLACSALQETTSIRPILCYYGAIFNFSLKHKPQSKCVTVLMSGTLCHETGADLLINSIKTMVIENPLWLKNIRFEITGKGDCLHDFKQLASDIAIPKIVVHGRLSDLDYADVLSRADVGLSLKLNNGPYANTTFPSKVIEYAAAGLLIVTTDISDVRKILGDGALYLEQDEPADLIRHFEFISTDASKAFEHAKIAQNSIKEICAPKLVSIKLCNFIFGQA